MLESSNVCPCNHAQIFGRNRWGWGLWRHPSTVLNVSTWTSWAGKLIGWNDCGNMQLNPCLHPKQDDLETGGKSGGRGKPKWNYGELSLPNWWGFIHHCQGQRIEVISFFMHGFCPHRDLKQRERVMREYSRGERWEEREVEMRKSDLKRRREGREKERQGEGRRKGGELREEALWQSDV